MRHRISHKATFFAAVFATLAGNALAADGWKVRFPLSGTLGGEIVAPIGEGGMYGQVAVTQIEVDKITGNDGNALKLTQSGTIPVPLASVNPALGTRSASYTGNLALGIKQSQTNVNAIIGYLSTEQYNGGRLSVAVNIPYTTMSRTITTTGATPTLSAISPSLTGSGLTALQSAGIQARTQASFDPQYQAGLAAQGVNNSGSPSGIGDIEVTGAWVYSDPTMKVVAGATLAMPTAQYDKNSTLNLGFGNYYTLRPGVAVAYNSSDSVTWGVRTSLGLNTRNYDNNIKTGNFVAVDLAAAFKTSVGVFGPHVMQVTQYEDDDGGQLGPNRFAATGVGVFYTAPIRSINAGLNFSYMQMMESRNALSGSFIQVRLSKAF